MSRRAPAGHASCGFEELQTDGVVRGVYGYDKWYMVKTTVYLDEDVVTRLRVLARMRGRSQAEMIRDALARFVEAESQSMVRPAPVGAGQFRSGRPDVGRRAEELLRQAARKRET